MKPLKKIYVVESDPLEVSNMKRLLSGIECEVTSIATTGDARTLLLGSCKEADNSGKPGLILLRNESEHNALRFLQELRDREATSNIPVILITDSIINQSIWGRFSANLYAQIATPVTYVKLNFALAGLGIQFSQGTLFITQKTEPGLG